MQIASIMGAVTAGFLAMGTAAVWPNSPPIDLRAVEYDPVSHVFSLDRKVRSREPIYSSFDIIFIDAETEIRVSECQLSSGADFGPDEKEKQSWPVSDIIGQECIDHLEVGRDYIVIMSVTPLQGSPDVQRSETFTIHGSEK